MTSLLQKLGVDSMNRKSSELNTICTIASLAVEKVKEKDQNFKTIF